MTGRRNPFLAMLVLGAGSATVVALAIGSCLNTNVGCPTNLKRCGPLCQDLLTDRTNCGGCDNACPTGQLCFDGGCACEPGSVLCGGYCSVTSTDPLNCGGCAGNGGVVCPDFQVCNDGGCGSTCPGTAIICPIDGGLRACLNTIDGGCGSACPVSAIVCPVDGGLRACVNTIDGGC